MDRRTTRRALLASTGLALAAGTTAGQTDDTGGVGDLDATPADSLLDGFRYPQTRQDNGVVVQFDDCSQVRIYGDPLEAATVSIATFYYTPQGNPWSDVLDLEANLPMTVDANEAYGDDAASTVLIGGVDVFDGDGNQLVTAQRPDDWNCQDEVEPPEGAGPDGD